MYSYGRLEITIFLIDQDQDQDGIRFYYKNTIREWS